MLALPIQSLSQFPVSVPGTVALAAVTAAAATDDKLSSCTVASSATLLSSRLYTSDIRCKKCKKNCQLCNPDTVDIMVPSLFTPGPIRSPEQIGQ